MEYLLVVYSTQFEYRVYSLLNPSVFAHFFSTQTRWVSYQMGVAIRRQMDCPVRSNLPLVSFRLPNASVEELDHLGLCLSGSPHGIPPSG